MCVFKRQKEFKVKKILTKYPGSAVHSHNSLCMPLPIQSSDLVLNVNHAGSAQGEILQMLADLG